MRLSIRHSTRYEFKEPVVHALQRLRKTPKETQGQQILEWDMQYENAHPELQYEDQNHNTVTLIVVDPGATEVTVTCKGMVQTSDYAGVIGHHTGHLPLWSFLGQTQLTKPGPQMRAMLREVGSPKNAGVKFLHELSAHIAETDETDLHGRPPVVGVLVGCGIVRPAAPLCRPCSSPEGGASMPPIHRSGSRQSLGRDPLLLGR